MEFPSNVWLYILKHYFLIYIKKLFKNIIKIYKNNNKIYLIINEQFEISGNINQSK